MGSILGRCMLVVLLAAAMVLGDSRQAAWRKVQKALDEGLPKSAIAALEPIVVSAEADSAYAEAVKAVALRIGLEGTIQGGKLEEKIGRLQAEIERHPAPMRPLLETILAHWYWQYFQSTRWRFVQRTQVAGPSGPDILTWDLPRILAEIDVHFTRALADEKALQAAPIGAFDELLTPGTMPDFYRPTLFDFVAHQALGFYSTGEQAGAAAEDVFALDAASPIFAPPAEFMRWRPEIPADGSPTLRGIQVFQRLLEFHRKDTDRSAFADADLERLVFGFNKALGDEKQERYTAALRRFVDENRDHEISALALGRWARALERAGDPATAHALALRGWKSFPASRGGRTCSNILRSLESKSVEIRTERVWNEPLPSIQVEYRNITRAFFRAVPYDFELRLEQPMQNPESIDQSERDDLLRRAPALEWSAELPPPADYKKRTQDLPAPRGLAPGFYVIVCSMDSSFSSEDNEIDVAPVWVSDLALVVREGRKAIEGFVLDARTGEPIPGARVEAWSRTEGGGRKRDAATTTTDGDGVFEIAPQDHWVTLVVRSGVHQLATPREHGAVWMEEGGGEQTVLFSDRSLYRPGQAIQYKGIHIRFDPATNDYRTMTGARITIVFSDANAQEIARQEHWTNDYGSFQGTFTVPRDRLTGRMTLTGPRGGLGIWVEEYKRPRFEAVLEAPKLSPRLGAEVTVPGRATAYTGAPVGGAKVEWRVLRSARFPVWCWWRRGSFEPGGAASQNIAHGTTTTGADGSFAIRFVARPSGGIAAEDEPTFEYRVTADVTDPAGETRSGERWVQAGYTALQASVAAGEWQTPDRPVELRIETRSLDGIPQAARGRVRLHRLQQPQRLVRGALQPYGSRPPRPQMGVTTAPGDSADPNNWPLGEPLASRRFRTDRTGKGNIEVALEPGIYRAVLETRDRFGTPVKAMSLVRVVDPSACRYLLPVAAHLAAARWSVEPGERFVALWGTGYETGRACVEIEHRGKILRRYWTSPECTQHVIEHPVEEAQRGGFALRVTFVRENRAYLEQRVVEVPWSNKQLAVKWESFRSKLAPRQKETWTAVVRGPRAEKAAVEMVAGLYDAALDAYRPHQWPRTFHVFGREPLWAGTQFVNVLVRSRDLSWTLRSGFLDEGASYRTFSPGIVTTNLGSLIESARVPAGVPKPVEEMPGADLHIRGGKSEFLSLPVESVSEAVALSTGVVADPNSRVPDSRLGRVVARRNLQETAFFFPGLRSDSTGVVRMEFTMPEALTEWRFLGFAHDRELRSGFLDDRAVTSKDLMVEPHPPRFVREGDVIEFTVKVTNRTSRRQTGRVELRLADASTLQGEDESLGNTEPARAFEVPGNESRTYAWRLAVPDGSGFLTYRAVGASDRSSDGEEGFLPVLSRRILVTESLPLPVRGKQTKAFELAKLLASDASTTLRHQSLTLQMVSQPAWYAVMALPYLMEFPHECSEQVFNRLYANSLARHIAASRAEIRRVFDLWKGTEALESPLEKNPDLESVLLEETPWVRQSQAEAASRRHVGVLFDGNRLHEETRRAERKLSEMQTGEGLWPWFPGGRPDRYITLYITTGFGRLRHLGVEVDVSPAVKSLQALDQWMDEEYDRLRRDAREGMNNLGPTTALYLYARSFFFEEHPVAAQHREAFDYWVGQAQKHWLSLGERQTQAHVALALSRLGDEKVPGAILKSLAERSVSEEELGMYWRDLERSWWWYRAPIETQAMMIEVFAEVAHDSAAVEACKVWLLKQKQTQDWKTTKATADAIYALLLRGDDLLASRELVQVALGARKIEPEAVEAGTGFYEQRFTNGEIRSDMGRVTVTKTDAGVGWGSLHWQYLEDMARVTASAGTPLTLQKALFVRRTTSQGPVLEPVAGPLAVGDELVTRVELRTDRDMEYVHLTDQRGSGTEPVNVLSGYRYRDGLAYYESTRDTASHFFIDYLPKGTYVFEYACRVQHRGMYQSGIASIQCMYAPEFNSHSESFDLSVH